VEAAAAIEGHGSSGGENKMQAAKYSHFTRAFSSLSNSSESHGGYKLPIKHWLWKNSPEISNHIFASWRCVNHFEFQGTTHNLLRGIRES